MYKSVKKPPLKLLIVTSALDLRLPYGCTNEWWYLFKALHELAVSSLVTVYQGRVIPSPWWESYENPCYWHGYVFGKLKEWHQRLLSSGSNQNRSQNTLVNQTVLTIARSVVLPRWRRHLLNILARNRDVDAVLFMNLPINQLQGIPTEIHDRYDVPVICYDTDLPVSLPRFGGFGSGFRIYDDVDLNEYDLFLGNSIGGVAELEKMGAKKALPLIWGVDPIISSPLQVPEQDIDVFFYGYGDEHRRKWMKWMLTEPSRQMSTSRFTVCGSGFSGNLENVELLSKFPLNRLREYCCRSKININILRDPHIAVYGSSTPRLFELAAMESCIVSNPYPGLEEWFEPEKEIFIVEEAEEVIDISTVVDT